MSAALTKIRSLLTETQADIFAGLRLWRFCAYRAWLNHKLLYRGAKLGLLWPIFSLAILVIILGSVWGVILGKSSLYQYILYLVVGFPIWQLISGAVDKGNVGFGSGLASSGLPLSTAILDRIFSVILVYANVLPIVIVALMVLGEISQIQPLLFLYALLCLVMWASGTIFAIAVIATIYPDTRHLISALMRVSFLATPIIWEAERLGEFQHYLWLNPFYAPLAFLRSTVTIGESTQDFLLYAPLYAFVVFVVGILLFVRYFNIVRQRA